MTTLHQVDCFLFFFFPSPILCHYFLISFDESLELLCVAVIVFKSARLFQHASVTRHFDRSTPSVHVEVSKAFPLLIMILRLFGSEHQFTLREKICPVFL